MMPNKSVTIIHQQNKQQGEIMDATNNAVPDDPMPKRTAFIAWCEGRGLDASVDRDVWGAHVFKHEHIQSMWTGWFNAPTATTQPRPVVVSAPSDDSKRLSAYATLVKAKDGQIAQLQAELAKHSEAVNTLASERTANAMLTAELENTRAAAPVTQPQAAMPVYDWLSKVAKAERGYTGSAAHHLMNYYEGATGFADQLRPLAAPPSPQPVADSAYDEFDRLRKLPKVPGYCAGTLHTEREAFDLAVRNATTLQPVADSEGLRQAADYIDRKAESYLQNHTRADYDTGATEWRNEKCRDRYFAMTELADEMRNLTPAAALQPVAGLTDAEISYELVQDDMVVAATSGFGAEREIRHYAAVYGPDGPVEILKVTRSRFDLFGNAGATGESK